MRFLRNKQRQPLTDVLHLLYSAKELLLRVKQDSAYKGDEDDPILLQKIFDEVQMLRLIVTYVDSCLYHRQRGESDPPAFGEALLRKSE
jgi:Fe-S oxidoreductase